MWYYELLSLAWYIKYILFDMPVYLLVSHLSNYSYISLCLSNSVAGCIICKVSIWWIWCKQNLCLSPEWQLGLIYINIPEKIIMFCICCMFLWYNIVYSEFTWWHPYWLIYPFDWWTIHVHTTFKSYYYYKSVIILVYMPGVNLVNGILNK